MSLLAEQAAEVEPRTGRTYTCKIADILAAVDDADRAVITARVDPTAPYSNRGLSDWLAKYGHHAGEGIISKHRRGACVCSRPS